MIIKHLLMMTKDLNVRSKITQFSEENREKLHDTRICNDLLNMTIKAQTSKEKINWTISKLFKIKVFCFP